MKITVTQLRRIIKEEVSRVMHEAHDDMIFNDKEERHIDDGMPRPFKTKEQWHAWLTSHPSYSDLSPSDRKKLKDYPNFRMSTERSAESMVNSKLRGVGGYDRNVPSEKISPYDRRY